MRTATRLALAALLLLAPAAAAQDAPRRPRLEKLSAKLGLSEAQSEQIRATAQRHADSQAPRRQAVRDARAELQRVLDTTPADAAAVRAASQRLEAARTELAVGRGARRADVRAALSPEQQQQAQQLRDAHRERKSERKAERHAAREERRAERHARKAAGKPKR